MKTREEISNSMVADIERKRTEDRNWFKCRIEGAWDSGYKNGYKAGVESIEFTEADAIDRLCYSDWLEKEKEEAYLRGIEACWNEVKLLANSSISEIEAIFHVSESEIGTEACDAWWEKFPDNITAAEAMCHVRVYKEHHRKKTNREMFHEVFGHIKPDDLFAKIEWWKAEYQEPENTGPADWETKTEDDKTEVKEE